MYEISGTSIMATLAVVSFSGLSFPLGCSLLKHPAAPRKLTDLLAFLLSNVHYLSVQATSDIVRPEAHAFVKPEILCHASLQPFSDMGLLH